MIKYIILSICSTLKLERHYPDCGHSGGNIHSRLYYRPISDIKVNSIAQRRMKYPFYKTARTIRSESGDRTNNATGRLIGLDYKIRVKTTEGIKNGDKILCLFYLSEYLRGGDGIRDLRKVV